MVVGSEADYFETQDYKQISMPARAFIGRGIRAANVISDEAKRKRTLAIPREQSRILVTSTTSAAGREASSARIAQAMQMAIGENRQPANDLRSLRWMLRRSF